MFLLVKKKMQIRRNTGKKN